METKRKGSRSVKDIPANILQQLNAGEIESIIKKALRSIEK
jgi:hypothetical protein